GVGVVGIWESVGLCGALALICARSLNLSWIFCLGTVSRRGARDLGKVQNSFVICNLFLSEYTYKNVLHITNFDAFSCFTFLSEPKLPQLHALGALLWDVKNEKS
ncbi:MAG: hypothetical protein IJ254_05685, partial [Succinivibrio sp.]|nr:hypothetical protein [Succinivibrio sp.]